MYGVPDVEGRGLKIALDRHGPPFDPDGGARAPGETFDAVRAYVERRFPALAGAPIVGAEVCQYENTSNGDFLIDRHPSLENVWIVGGGSGHGFKHGPAVGEYAARLVEGGAAPEPRFLLAAKERVQRRNVF
jgi:glycine/D-amino acid oxidase-like deaminating enzyme